MMSRQLQPQAVTPNKSDTMRKKKPGKLSKADISSPSSFIHVSGVSRGESGMQMVDNSHLIHDPVIRQLLKSSNIDASSLGASDLQDVQKFAQDANLYEHYHNKRRSMKMNNASPRNKPYSPPQHMTPLQENKPNNNSSPSRPARRIVDNNGQNTLQKKTIEKPNKQPPALPPRRIVNEKPKPVVQPPVPKPSPSGPPTQGGAPPPPPPPPAPGPPPPPAPGPITTPSPAPKPSDGRVDLLKQIQGGPTLKPVSDDKKAASPGKMDLFDEIKKGKTLKPVIKSEEPSPEPKQPSTGNPLIDALVSHLDKFKEANFSSDESESESGFDEDDDEW